MLFMWTKPLETNDFWSSLSLCAIINTHKPSRAREYSYTPAMYKNRVMNENVGFQLMRTWIWERREWTTTWPSHAEKSIGPQKYVTNDVSATMRKHFFFVFFMRVLLYITDIPYVEWTSEFFSIFLWISIIYMLILILLLVLGTAVLIHMKFPVY